MIGALGELCARIYEFLVQTPIGLHVDHSAQGFLTFKVGKTQFRGLCLSPLSRALGQLSKYEIKKGGHFILRQSLQGAKLHYFSFLSHSFFIVSDFSYFYSYLLLLFLLNSGVFVRRLFRRRGKGDDTPS